MFYHVQHFYDALERHQYLLNDKAQTLSKYIIAERWLESYQTFEGICSILYRMDRRTGFVSKMQYAIEDLKRDEKLYEEEFTQFFKEIQMM